MIKRSRSSANGLNGASSAVVCKYMGNINTKETVAGDLETVIQHVSAALQTQGFGILTRIDLHVKFLEKLGKKIRPAVILGACNPQLAYEAYQQNTDVASLLPCNVVIRSLDESSCSVDATLPSSLLSVLGDAGLTAMAATADRKILSALNGLAARAA